MIQLTAVAEADGESASEPATATVAAPVVNAPTASITGNSTDGYPVTGQLQQMQPLKSPNAEGEVVGTGTANENGNYSITLNPADVAENENLNVAVIVRAVKLIAVAIRQSFQQTMPSNKREHQRSNQ